MEQKVLTLTTGEKVYIFDKVFNDIDVEYFNMYCQNSKFRTGFNSSTLFENMTYALLTSPFEEDDIKSFGIFEKDAFKQILPYLEGLSPSAMWLTLTRYMPEVYFHPDDYDPKSKSMLYYVNSVWNKDYGGETIICNSQGEIELAISPKPNRLVIFNSFLLHKVSGLSPKAPPNRFSFVSIWR